MNSFLYQGELRHARLHAVPHEFVYPLHLFALDLDDLKGLEQHSFWFGHNCLRPLSLYDKDYLYADGSPLREKIQHALQQGGISTVPARVLLVTALRQWHYVFNPVSFFYCLDSADQLQVVLAQVNNTFAESHLYILQSQEDDISFSTDKAFHVSPFFPRSGQYRFRLSPPGEALLSLEITYLLDGQPALIATFTGKGEPLTPAILAKTVLRHPLRAVMTFPRILRQAAHLYLRKKLPVFTKPEPDSPLTIRRHRLSWLQRLGKRVLTDFFSRLDRGSLTMVAPDGEVSRFGPDGEQNTATIAVGRHGFYPKVMLAADIGLGESYVDGDWSSPDLVALLTLLSAREEAVNDRRIWPALAGRALNYLSHINRHNSLQGSRRNIQDHYDLGNDFYQLILDPTMAYSSGLFTDAAMSLEQAQQQKVRSIIAKAGIRPEDHVLEIGCGWGGFALQAVRECGCRLTALTISPRQFQWVQDMVLAQGLGQHMTVQLMDYRQVRGQFDKIVSIEMIEAVGHRYLPGYFQVLERLLAPKGKIVLQAISMPDQKYQAYRFGSDWIRKHIFPGGHLPSLGAMVAAMTRSTKLNVVDLEDIGRHYITTLALWRKALVDKRQQILGLGFDERFLRKWDYYFSYCQAGFTNQLIRNYHIVLTRMGESEE